VTSDEIRNTLREALGPAPQAQGPAPQAPAAVVIPLRRKEAKWPEWDGRAEAFISYRFQLRVKIEEDRALLGTDRSICLSMINTLPAKKKERVSYWFESGGPGGIYAWESFLEHFTEQFEDKQAKQAAGEQLSRMRQGSAQLFTDYLQDFEYKLAQCGGQGWADSARIIQLNTGINNTLRMALIAKTLPDDDYARWVSKVKAVAGRLEGLSSYKPKGVSSSTKTWYLNRPGAGPSIIAAPSSDVGRVDAEGDTRMGGINALMTMLAAFQSGQGVNINALQLRNSGAGTGSRGGAGALKPRAPWRTREVFQQLIERSLCVRCERPGHRGPECLTYRPARRPATITATGIAPLEQVLRVAEVPSDEDSGNEEP
jgi:hypothetical protein